MIHLVYIYEKTLNEKLDKAASHPQLHTVHEYNNDNDKKHAHRDGYVCNRKEKKFNFNLFHRQKRTVESVCLFFLSLFHFSLCFSRCNSSSCIAHNAYHPNSPTRSYGIFCTYHHCSAYKLSEHKKKKQRENFVNK